MDFTKLKKCGKINNENEREECVIHDEFYKKYRNNKGEGHLSNSAKRASKDYKKAVAELEGNGEAGDKGEK